nr:UBP-type zinc finger domain-containing protein [Thermoleptolyngbya oregonensis]
MGGDRLAAKASGYWGIRPRVRRKWVHLRICQTCGKMLCCDSSKHQHARRHYEETGHPVMSSAELGEDWLWCFVDEAAKEY